MTPLTPRELMEKHGLQAFHDIRQLDGSNPDRAVIRDPALAARMGVEPGAIVAMPPGNPNSRQLSLQRGQRITQAPTQGGNTSTTRWVEDHPAGPDGYRWLYRCETPHWQAELQIETDIHHIEDHLEAEPIYRLLDGLKILMGSMLEAAWRTKRWPQMHRTEAQIRQVLEDPGETIGLHQRYG